MAFAVMACGIAFGEQNGQGGGQVQGGSQAIVNHTANVPLASLAQEVRPTEQIYFMIVIAITVVVYFILRAVYFRRLKNNKDRQ